MVDVGGFAVEKAELEAVLSSGIFDRAPMLAQLLAFVCNKYFQGLGAEIKEYNIAIEALGRPPGFDQKRDSIVRVQFHRLRERLHQYYEKESTPHAVRIEIPQGQYVPRFVLSGGAVAPVPAAPPPPQTGPAGGRRPLWTWVAGAALLVALGGAVFLISNRPAQHASRGGPGPGATSGSDSVRILVGLAEGTFTDGFGKEWESDRYYQGGSVVNLPGHPIAGTREPRLYQSRRQGSFRYDIPLAPGVYEVRLYFAETNFGEDNTAGYGGENSRAFSIQLNGKTVLDRLDVVGETGASAADIKVFRDVSPAADGKLHLGFRPLVSVPFLNAIEITPGIPGQLKPVRIVAQPQVYTDSAGIQWLPDRVAVGGQLVRRTPDVPGASDPQLYAGERFGNLTYTFPVPPGRYAVTLYMAERWLGPGMPGGGGAGSRLFDILCNGVALARNFDVFERAGGANRALVTTYHGLQPDHQGRLVISLLPVRNFAIVNAIEVTDESKSQL